MGVTTQINTPDTEEMLSKEEMMLFANSLAAEQATVESWDVLDQYSDEYCYDNECSLLSARLYAIDGDYERAYGIYKRLSEDGEYSSRVSEEKELLERKLNENQNDTELAKYITASGENPEDYGLETVSTSSESVTADEIADLVCSSILKDYSKIDGSDNEKCASYVAEAETYYSDYTAGKAIDTEKLEKLAKKLERMEEEHHSIYSQRCMRMARLKVNVLNENYGEIAEALNENSSYDELMIASELYMSGNIKSKDFPESYTLTDDNGSDNLKEQLKETYEKLSDDLNTQETKALKKRINAIEKEIDEPVLSNVKYMLADKAENEAGTDKSKVYLEMAKIENYFENESTANEYINQAIYDSPDCLDDSYTAPMSQIIKVISNDGTDDTENIKNVTDYVDAVIDNSLTINVYEQVSTPVSTGSANGDDEAYNYDNDYDSNNGDESESSSSDSSTAVDFAQTMTDYVSKVKSAIVIGKIDTSDFEKITARVQISSDYSDSVEKLKQKLSVSDCGVPITDFELKKIEFSGSNILLLCDVSGSMQTSIGDLRDAVTTFINDKNDDENLAIVTFDDGIVEKKNFGSSDSQLMELAEKMTSMGGTDMFSALVDCLESFESGKNTNDVIILMTDGQDNDPRDSKTINSKIGGLAVSKGITVYTLGLGSDVDTVYLSTIADSASGDFVYVSDSSSLNTFYDMLHGQVSNQYELTYTAKDTMTVSGRTLEVALTEENVRDSKTYSLNSSDDEEEDGETENTLSATENLAVSGLSARYIYKGTESVDLTLNGSGFKEEYTASLKLNGNIDYDIALTYSSDSQYKLTIPASIAVGSYDVEITVDGKKAYLKNGFEVILQGAEKELKFGPYVFTAVEKIKQTDGSYLLRGAVKMNGWLNFKGDITITGDPENDGSIRVCDNSGSYVQYDEATAVGLSKIFAQKGIAVDFPAFGEFTLYNDESNKYDYDNYTVDEIQTAATRIFSLITFDSPTFRIYPDSVKLHYSTGQSILPFQDTILKAVGTEDGPTSFSYDGDAVFTDKNIGVIIKPDVETELSDNDISNGNYKSINLFNSPVYFKKGECNLSADTIKNEYSLEFMVQLNSFDFAVGADLSWKGLQIDSFVAHLDKDINTTIGSVPVTYSDFSLGAEDIAEAVESHNFWKLKAVGGLSVSCGKASAYFPALENYLGDMSLLSIPDANFKLGFDPFSLTAQASLKFLDEITLANAEIELGTFDYTNAILGLDNAETTGIRASLTTGIDWSNDSTCSIKFTGTGEANAHKRFIGIQYTGTAMVDFKWWIFSKEFKDEGTCLFGVYTSYYGEPQLVFAVKEQDTNGKVGGIFLTLDKDGNIGKNSGDLK